MNKDEAFRQFNKVLTIRNLAPRTIHTYNCHLNRFLTWADREDVSSIDLPVIQDYVYHLLEIGNSPSDVNVAECAILSNVGLNNTKKKILESSLLDSEKPKSMTVFIND